MFKEGGSGAYHGLASVIVPGDVILRDCSHSDFGRLAEMERSYYSDVDQTEVFDEARFFEEFKTAISDPRKRIMVAQVQGSLAGFIWLEEYDEEEGVLGYITNIHVAREHRGRGIAKHLLREAEEHFRRRNVRRLQLEVVEWNKSALNLYVKNGYQLTRYERQKNDFTPAGDYLEKSLT